MGSEVLSVRNSGIYHNLPQFDPFIKDLTAIITGANGISGFQTLRALLDSPQRWAKIYAISRRPPPPAMMSLLSEEQQSRVQHVASDFLKPAAEVAEALRAGGVSKVDYVFFYSYLQPPPPKGSAPWSNVEELTKVNTALLKNFIEALPIAGLKPKRFSLQTGAKNCEIDFLHPPNTWLTDHKQMAFTSAVAERPISSPTLNPATSPSTSTTRKRRSSSTTAPPTPPQHGTS